MATSRKYTVKIKRKRQGRTNYKLRLNLLKSGKYRLIIRKSLKNILLQIVKSENSKDKVIIASSSTELKKMGWSYSSGNIPSSYLTGLILGKKALKNNIKGAILDIGLQNSVVKSRIYAALKGSIDAGLKVPHNSEMFPSQERIKGSHLKKEMEKKFEEIKNKIEHG